MSRFVLPSRRAPRLSRRELLAYLAGAGLLASCTEPERRTRPRRPRVLVVGAGVAGLSAGIHLLEQSGGELHVDLIFQGHLLGGKATSWSEGEYLVGHGFHVLFGFYAEMLALIGRGRADLRELLVPSDGHVYFYEERDRTIHNAAGDFANYTGFSAQERRNLDSWALQNALTILGVDQRPELDELSFEAWGAQTGLLDSVLATNFIRYTRDVIFNYPEPISAYTVLKFLRAGLDQQGQQGVFDVFYANGDMVECFIAPMANHFEALGGTLTPQLKVRRLVHSGQRITGVEVAEPDPPPSHCGTGQWPDGTVSTHDDTSHVLDHYDAVLMAVPYEAFLELNPGDGPFWSESSFKHVHKLQSAASLSCRFWCNEPAGTESYRGILNGMPEPVPTVIDMKHILPRYADARWQSVIDCCGPLRGYEELDDDALIALIGERIASVPGLRNPMACAPDKVWLRRNTGKFGRLMLPVPGALKYRPYPKTQLDNLFLAGDWIRNSLDIPTMEGAARAGRAAAEQLLERLG